MNPRSTITWESLALSVDASGDIVTAVDLAGEAMLFERLAVVLPAPWRRDEVEVLHGEVEQRWVHPGGATAVVRQVFDRAWTLRVVVLNRGPKELPVPAPRLLVEAPWPTRRLLAGGEAFIQFDPGRAEQLVLTQLQGHAVDGDGEILLAPDPLPLAACSSDGVPGQFTISWRAVWLRDHRHVAQVLPAWWPTTALPEGQEAWFALPDAAVTSDEEAVAVTQHEDGSSVVAEPGHHTVLVHNRWGTTEVEIGWAGDLDTVARRRALHHVEHTDPRTCRPWQVWTVARCLDHLGQDATRWLQTAVEESLARHGAAHPLEVMAACTFIAREDARDLWSGVESMVERLPTVVGTQMAMVHARLLAMQQGVVSPSLRARRSAPDDALGAVERALCDVEAQMMAPAPEPDEIVWRVAGLLGAGLPGRSVGPVPLAQGCMVAAMFPEHWAFDQRWPTSLARVRDEARHRVLADIDEPEGDEALAWLLVGA